jgi:uncharacterized protein (DUF4415 family)
MSRKKVRLPKISDAEEARIQRGIALDPDNPEWTEEDFRKAKPFAEVFPDLAESIRRSRGRPTLDNPKKQVTIRLDGDVLEKFREGGPGWQSRINDILRKAAGL